ncbi:nucleoside kinase [[Clostridium] aminophilum]|uniref:Uridine kinase n=1 Tax=[Clostridium] aminophilum TaxID=1526 RepID=A0A1I6K363_9FIRM|nr:nucleoside kinase [[Clostridium] aminophilum]SFR85616.1 uridine kinase [[Clostridium] aminophilum]
MLTIKIGEDTYEVEHGTAIRELTDRYENPDAPKILLAEINGKLRELHRPIEEAGTLTPITARDKSGLSAYSRSALFLLMKAFFDVCGKDDVNRLKVLFSIGSGLYLEPRNNLNVTQELLDRVDAEMRRLSESRIPIHKRSINTDDAIALFHKHHMFDKERLFHYRRASRVNVYSIENFDDYFFGYMVPDTGYIRTWKLALYGKGFVLLLPTVEDPDRIPEFSPSSKLFEIQREADTWGAKLGVFDVGTLNDAIAEGRTQDLILMQEAIQEKKIGEIAEEIYRSGRKIILIAGPSSSGKTTFSHRLSIQLAALGLTPHPIETDNYFVDRTRTPRDENGKLDFESIDALDVDLLSRDINALLRGEQVELPKFNFLTGTREYNKNFLQIGEGDVLVLEGIHCLNEKLSGGFPKDKKFKIYISALTQLNIDEHNRIPTTDGRLIRRIIRDARTRGHGAQATIAMWDSVRRGEEKNIFPYQDEADVMFNSALLYELSVLKQFAEPLLYRVPRDSEEYPEAKRLLKFLSYFLGVSSETVPNNSLLREFVGGGCFGA